jgi:hypothetical protein
VVEVLAHFPGQLGLDMTGGYSVSPAQFLGLEINPRAAAIADVVLWIGCLQWHLKTYGDAKRLNAPILKDYGNIVCRDAVLEYRERVPRLDKEGKPVTRWDGITTRPHPVTGQEVPDEAARTAVYEYLDPKPAQWPEADFIVGNPPFIGTARMREALGDGYTEALRKTYQGQVPESADFVMYWWHKAAELVKKDNTERFGFIATNSLKQTFNRKVLQNHLSADNLSLVYAIPDHPWVAGEDGAAVRISMTVAIKGKKLGRLTNVISETEKGELGREVILKDKLGKIQADLSVGADVVSSVTLRSNENLSNRGVCLFGAGFVISKQKAFELGLGKSGGLENHIRKYLNGKDLTASSRNAMVIDLFGMNADEVRSKYPLVYQYLLENVKPERDQNNRQSRRDNWWIFGEPNPKLRHMVLGLKRFIATVETSKHRFFTFLDKDVLPDNKLVNIALDDAYFLGVLSSKSHVVWATAAGSTLEDRPVYVKSQCFDPFPFPATTEPQKTKIRHLAEQLDAHRKARQAEHPTLTMTDMYNVLEKLRNGEALTAKDKTVHSQGLVAILRQLHDELDAAAAEAYGWPVNLPEAEILERLVALNKQRAEEETRGLVRYLRPGYQNPGGTQQGAIELVTAEKETIAEEKELLPWPKTLAEQAQAVQRTLQTQDRPASPGDILRYFKATTKEARTKRLEQVNNLLETLFTLGLVRKTEEGKYVG